jgi:hypothetical protein
MQFARNLSLALALVLSLAVPRARADSGAVVAPDVVTHTKTLVLPVGTADLRKGEADTLTAWLTTRVSRFASLEVLSGDDVHALVDVEAERRTAGCSDDNGCLAEIAGALGAGLVVSTQAGKLGEVYVVTVNVFDAKAAKAKGRVTVQSWSLGEIPEKLGPALDDMLSKALGEHPTENTAVVVDHKPARQALGTPLPLALQLTGTGLAVIGGVTFGVSLIPAIGYASAHNQLEKLTLAHSTDLAAGAKLQTEAAAARKAWNGLGIYGAWVGGVVVLGGAGCLIASALLPAEER